MKRRDSRAATPGAPRGQAPRRAPAAAIEPLPRAPLGHPAWIAALVAAAACVVLNVTFRMDDPDVWEHLLVGKALWQTHAVPLRQIWCWPTYGEPQVLPSWAFRALLWPFWAAGGPWGLAVWRWLTTLLAFGLAYAAARRMGARGFAALLLLVLAELPWRIRSQARPEMLAAVLLALQIWILETRRTGGPDRSWWVVAIAWLYANAHISYIFGLALTGFYLLDAWWRRRGDADGRPSRLVAVLAGSCAISFVNPFGWRGVWQPFDYYLHGRHELIYRTIRELAPIQWHGAERIVFPVLLGLWALLVAARWRRHGVDVAEALTIATFGALAARNQRFLGLAALVVFPFVARDLESWLAARRLPAWARPPGARAALAAAGMALACVPAWRLPMTPFGIEPQMKFHPVGACDYMAAHDVRGHGFNPFYWGGYLLWRFWPDPGRLPFMDIHQTGTPRARFLIVAAGSNPSAYRALQAEWRFDWALLDRRSPAGPILLDYFAQDSAWAPVFIDDAAVLFVRRAGPLAALAARDAYRLWPPSWPGLERVAPRWNGDAAFRRALRPELERQVRASPWNSLAHQFLGNLALLDGDEPEAARQFRAALQVEPRFPELHLKLAKIAERAGRLDEAERELHAELAVTPGSPAAREGLAAVRAERTHR